MSESENLHRYRAIFESAVDFAIIAFDSDGLVTDWNKGAEAIFGWSAGEMHGQSADRFFTPEDRADGRVGEEMRLALQTGRASDERWHLRKDSARFWASGEMMPLRDQAGTHIGFLKIARDETGKYLAAERQRADREFMQGVLAALDDCIKVLDLDANLLFMSEGGRRVMEVEDFETIRGCPWPGFWEGDLNAEARAAVAAARAGRSAQFRGPASTMAGSPRSWDVRLSPIPGRDGRPEKLLVISRDVTKTMAAEQALREGEARWRGLFETLQEGFVVGELVRDADGHVTDWRYLDVNPAWASLVGISAEDAKGRTIRELFPGIEDVWVDEIAGVVASGAPTVFTRQVGTIARWYEGRAVPLGGDRFGVLFLEVTQRIGADLRRDALLALNDRFRNLSETDDLADAACAALGAVLDVDSVGYALIDPAAETISVEHEWTNGDTPRLTGTMNFRDFGSYIDDLKRGEVVAVEDARTDERTRAFAPALEARHARAFVNMPLLERGSFVAMLYVLTREERRWSAGELDFVHEIASRTRVATARLIAERERRAAEAELRLVLDALPLLVAFVDRSLTYRVANAGYRDWFDCNPAEVIGRQIPELLSPEGFAARRPFIESALAGTPSRFDLPWPWADGRRRIAEIQYVPRFDRRGAVDGFYVFVQDVTAQRGADALLTAEKITLTAEVEERTAERDRLWDTTSDLMGTAGFDGYLKTVNPAWTSVLGWTEAEILSRPFVDLIAPADQDETADVVRRLAGGETVTGFVDRVYTRDGGTRAMMWSAAPDLGRDVFHIVGRDLTEQRQVEEALRQSQKMEAVGQLTGGIAHDFNNLLTGITGALDIIDRRVSQGRYADIERFAAIAQGSAKRAAALTHRLLAFSRQQTLDPRSTNVNRLITGIEELIRRTVGPAVHIEAVKAAGLWPTLVDPNQLENALLNLCINARDAMPDGGRLTIETANRWIDQRTARDRELPAGQYVSLSVSDTGTGMSPQVIAKAFDPFFTTKPLGQGTGLGLSMIYGFARQSGGQARIYSEMGQGTTVCLYLPRHIGEAEEAEQAMGAGAVPKAEAGETVLIVDDEASIRALVLELLRDLGYAAIEAADGASGLKVLQSDARVDLLVTDVGLPGGMNGRQLADAARVSRPDLKVLFITGYAENAAVGNGHLSPGMHVMTKPFALDAIASRMRELIDGRVSGR